MSKEMSIIDKVNRIAALAGHPIDVDGILANSLLEDEMADLKTQAEYHENTLEFLRMQLDAGQAEYDAEKQLNENLLDTCLEEVEKAKKKASILETYIKTIVEADEFRLNLLARQNTETMEKVWLRLKPIHDGALKVKAELEELRQLRKKCDELKQRIMQPTA